MEIEWMNHMKEEERTTTKVRTKMKQKLKLLQQRMMLRKMKDLRDATETTDPLRRNNKKNRITNMIEIVLLDDDAS